MTWQGGKRLRRLARGGGKSLFISYRREDTSGYAGRLFETLAAYVGRERLFMDVDTIRPGEDFLKVIEQTVGSSEAVIVLIGPRWLSAVDADGRPRLEDPEDFVRLEVKAALDRGLRVIPVLVDGATVPDREQLPSDLAALTRRHAVHLTHERWQTDVEHLVRSLGLKRRRPAWWLAAAAAVGLLAALGGFLAIRQTDQTPRPQDRSEEEAVAGDAASPAETTSPAETRSPEATADRNPWADLRSRPWAIDAMGCEPVSVSMALGDLAHYRCRSGSIEAHFWRWPSAEAMSLFTLTQGREAERYGVSGEGWSCTGDDTVGLIFEYTVERSDGSRRPTIYWTHDEGLYSARAVHLEGKAKALHRWWWSNEDGAVECQE